MNQQPVTAPWLKTTFLNAGLESFGFVPDALPVAMRLDTQSGAQLATRQILVAATGYGTDNGGTASRYEGPGDGLEALMTRLCPWLCQDLHAADILRMTLGECTEVQEFLLDRLRAVVAEAEVFRILRDAPPEVEATGHTLETTLPQALQRLDAAVAPYLDARQSGPADEAYQQVSVGACRVCAGGEDGTWEIQIFSAGNFCVYLLDGQGLSPLYMERTRGVTAKGNVPVMVRRLDLYHPAPFAILLLSGGICRSTLAHRRSSQEAPGRLWRSRMQLEEQLLQAFDSAPTEDGWGEAAARWLDDHVTGQDSASGAMTWFTADSLTYDDFRSICHARLQTLREVLALLPETYDPTAVVAQEPLQQMERRLAAELFRTRPQLLSKTLDRLDAHVREKLLQANSGATAGAAVDATASPTDVSTVEIISTPGASTSSIDRAPTLTSDMVYTIFRRFDKENDADRLQIENNRQILRRILSGHWVTIRPCLYHMEEAMEATREDMSIPHESHTKEDLPREKAARMYRTCLDMNNRLHAVLQARREHLQNIRDILQDGLQVMEEGMEDWVMGRGSSLTMFSWMDHLVGDHPETLSGHLKEMQQHWTEETERVRSLQSAYTAEREALFAQDALAEEGFWRESFAHMQDGTLAPEQWARCRQALMSSGRTGYGELWDALRAISESIAALRMTIEGRAAERRCVLTLRQSFDWQFACLRAAVYGDTTWGEDICALVDDSTRNDYMRAVHDWHATESLHTHQREAFDTYRDMYETYDQKTT